MEEENKVEEVKEETKTEEVASETAEEELNTEEVSEPVVQEPSLEEPVSDPVLVKPVKRSKKDIIGYNPETGEPIYREIVPGEVSPKKSKKGLIIGIIIFLVVVIAGIVTAILLFAGKDDEEEEEELTIHDYRKIVDNYGASLEDAIADYMDDEDEVPEFKDVKNNIKYKKYAVSCETLKINYDGTVYLANCSVDGKKVKNTITYGVEKEEPVKILENIYFYKENGKMKYTKNKADIDEDDVEAEFECEEDKTCSIYNAELFSPGIMSNNKVFIMQNDPTTRKYIIILYDIDEEKKVGTYGGVSWLFNEGDYVGTDGKYILVKKTDEDVYGVIDKDGKMIHGYNLGRKNTGGIAGSRLFPSIYSVENDYFATYKDGKFGISKITSEEIVVEPKYEDIKLFNNKYFKAQEAGKWYLISYETKEKVLTNGYDFVFGIYNDAIVVANEKKLYIKDLEGKDLLAEPIEVTGDLMEEIEACCGLIPGATVKTIDEKKIGITVYNGSYSDKTEYTFDTTTKTLEK